MPIKNLSKTTIVRALSRLNELAAGENITLEVCIYGGVAMMLAYDSRAATKDVDAILKPAEIGKKLAARVAEELSLHENWLNDDVRQFLGDKPSTRPLQQYSDWPHLKINVPVGDYLLAMKALACRDPLPGYRGDLDDLEFLIREQKITSIEIIEEKINKYYPDDILKPGNLRTLQKLIRKVHEEKQSRIPAAEDRKAGG